MANAWALVAQTAYFLMFLGMLGWNVNTLRVLFLAGSVFSVVYSTWSDVEPLWIPLTWHGMFIVVNGLHLLSNKVKQRKQRLDPLETFMKKTAFGHFPPEEIKSFVRIGMEGGAKAGEQMAQAGSGTKEVFFILSGNAGIFEDGAKVRDVVAGRLFGMSTLLGASEVPNDVVASTEVKAMIWTNAAIEDWVGKDVGRLALVQGMLGMQIVEQIMAEAAAKKRAIAQKSGIQSEAA